MNIRSDISSRPNRSQAELWSDSKTVRYELDMLLSNADAYAQIAETSAVVLKNALVESFAVHCRAMIFFLFGHLDGIAANGVSEGFAKPRSTDVLAVDFCYGWSSTCPAPSEVLVRAKRQADKHVAHITTDRREVNQPGSGIESVWRIGEVAAEIAKVMDSFLRTAPANVIEWSERCRMSDLISPWLPTHAASVPTPSTMPPSFHNTGQALCGRTEPKTVSPPPGISFHGRTE